MKRIISLLLIIIISLFNVSCAERAAYVAKHPELPITYKKAITAGKIMIGMTKEQVIASWGNPNKINKSVGSWGVHEQWVYSSQYLYFENGKLTSWQD
jgi:hypothetical protein